LNTIVERLRMFRGKFDLGADFIYGVFNERETEVWGGTGLHPRVGSGGIEIGYWVHVDHVNQGLATELAGALTRVAMEILRVNRVHIMCDPRNAASAAVPRKLGYAREATLRDRFVLADGSLRDTEVWSLFRAEYGTAAAAGTSLRTYDAAGEPIECP
jgi:RimJ/RimL family protein N-acetyltransferase